MRMRHMNLSAVACLALSNYRMYLMFGTISGGGIIEHKMCFDFLYNLCLKYFLIWEEFKEKLP